MINLSAALNSTGYGCAATNIFRQLWRRSTDLCLWPIGSSYNVEPDLVASVERALANRKKFDGNMPSLKIWHQNQLADRYSNNISGALTFFELDTLSDEEICNINSLDVLFVASRWAKDIVDRHCDVKCVVAPMGVDTKTFYPMYQLPNDDTYRFFSCGKIEVRKGHDVLHEIFNRAFRPNDNVELHIKWSNPFLSDQDHAKWEHMYKNTPLGHKIFFHKTKSQEQLNALINQCDCGIFPTRAEGFGLSILETIACNKPVITTNYSAPTEFCHDRNAFLVTPETLEPAYDGKWFFLGSGNWAKLGDKEIQAFADHMRSCYEQDIRTNNDFLNTTALYNWSFPTEIITNHLGVS